MSARKQLTDPNDLKLTLTNLNLSEQKTPGSPASSSQTLISQLKRQLLIARHDNRVLKEKLRVLSTEFNRLRDTANGATVTNQKLACGPKLSGQKSTLNAYMAKIETLEKQLYEKDLKLKRVQNELYLSRIYQKKCFLKYSKEFTLGASSTSPTTATSRHLNLLDSVTNLPGTTATKRCCCTISTFNENIKNHYENLAKDNVLQILPKLFFAPKPECKNRNLRFLSCHLDSVLKQIDSLRAKVTQLEHNHETFSNESKDVAVDPAIVPTVAPCTTDDHPNDYSEISEEILIENY